MDAPKVWYTWAYSLEPSLVALLLAMSGLGALPLPEGSDLSSLSSSGASRFFMFRLMWGSTSPLSSTSPIFLNLAALSCRSVSGSIFINSCWMYTKSLCYKWFRRSIKSEKKTERNGAMLVNLRTFHGDSKSMQRTYRLSDACICCNASPRRTNLS